MDGNCHKTKIKTYLQGQAHYTCHVIPSHTSSSLTLVVDMFDTYQFFYEQIIPFSERKFQ